MARIKDGGWRMKKLKKGDEEGEAIVGSIGETIDE